MASFDRIFNLAKKTGDRLIVFDSSTGDGFATIPLDVYERMIDDPRRVRELSEDEFSQQINEDIALWNAHQDAQDQEELDRLFGRAYEDNRGGAGDRLSDSDDDTGFDPWHSTADVLHGRYDDLYTNDTDADIDSPSFSFDDDKEYNGLVSDEHVEAPLHDHDQESEDDILPEDFFAPSFAPSSSQTTPIPQAEDTPSPSWEEEPLDEEPIFFEEPVE